MSIFFKFKLLCYYIIMIITSQISKIRHNYIWNNKIISWTFFINLFLCLAFFGIIFYISNGKQDVVPLSYNIYYGSSNFGPIQYFFVFPAITSVIFLINYILCYHYYKHSRVLSYFLVGTTTAINILMILAFILLVLFIET